MRLVLDRRFVVKRVGQPVEAVLIEPVFAYDRVVIPAGTRVLGHVDRRTAVSTKRRAFAMLSGDFTPHHDILLQFDAMVLPDGRSILVRTHLSAGTEDAALVRAGGAGANRRNKTERMKDTALRALPYHPEFLSKGTLFSARLLTPVDFGPAAPTPGAPAGTLPAPESVLSARLVAPIDSGHATRGTPIEAVVTRPVFSAAHELVLPAGATLSGQVTFVKRAGHFRRNGQLRLLFERVQVPGHDATPLLASVYAVEGSRADRLALDEEGGAGITNPATRFIVPALGTVALIGLSQGHVDYDTDDVGPETEYGGAVSGGVAGLVGASLAGVLMSSLGHPVAVALGAIGVLRTTYAGVVAKGTEVVFPADTRIQVQLAPRARPRMEGEMRHEMTRPSTIGVAVMLGAAVAAAQGAKHDLERLPAAVKQAILANKPGAEIDKLEIEKESGIALYDIEFKGGQGEIEVAEDGTVMDVTTIVEERAVPGAAATAIKAAANGKEVKQYERSEVRAEIVKDAGKWRISRLSTPKYVYEAELTKGEVEVTADGKVIKVEK